MLERILVPLDGSPLAEKVIAQVRRILFHADAEVILASVLPPELQSDRYTQITCALKHEIDGYVAEAQEYVNRMARRLTEQGARVRALARFGPPAETLLDIAAGEGASMIAMSTHGRSGLSRWTYGSVAEKVLRASPVPLLLVRSFTADVPGRPVTEPLRLERILVPIDPTQTSLEVIPAVVELGRLFGAHVLVLHVCKEHPECAVPVPQITQAYGRLKEAGLTVEPVMRQGEPAEEILEACREHSTDLIAMATHGRTGASRWMLGSVAEKVLRHASVPMLVVPEAASRRSKVSPEAAAT